MNKHTQPHTRTHARTHARWALPVHDELHCGGRHSDDGRREAMEPSREREWRRRAVQGTSLAGLRCSNKPSHAVELSYRVGCCSVLGVRFRRSSSTQCTTATCRCAGGSLGRSCGQSQAWSRGLASGLGSSWQETLASRPSATMTDTERARGALHSQQPLRVRSRESGTRVPSQ